jgi:S1-C subfamily serine protease
MMNDQTEANKSVVRVSLLWLLLGAALMVLLGMGGGVLVNLIWSPTVLPLTEGQELITTTVQEVTISPNKAVAEIVDKADKSIVGITVIDATNKTLLANGVVVTNDGLVVTSASLPKVDLTAIDYLGMEAPLSVVGSDELYGLTYLKFEEGVVGPLDVRKEGVSAGSELLLLGRAKLTFLPQVEKWGLKEWILPPEISPRGMQRIWRGTMLNDPTLTSGALIDDEGRLAGLLMNGPAGLAISAEDLLISMQRLSQGKREIDPLRDLGIKLHFNLQTSSTDGRQFTPQITSVEEDTPAALAGLKVQDVIVGINGNKLSWDKSLVSQIMEQPVREVTVKRSNRAEDIVLTINAKPQ